MGSPGNTFGEYTLQKNVVPEVSIIVASHRENYIENFVSFFNVNLWESVRTEVIIVADYEVDTYVKKFPEKKWLYVPEKSISAKRNRGIIYAEGDICGFIDDDCCPYEKWVSTAKEFLDSHREYAGVEGMTTVEEKVGKAGAYKEFKRLEKRGYRTNNIFYRKQILLEINLFDERFTVQREDADLAYSIIESGYSIGYSKEIRVKHLFRKNEKWDMLKNCINRRFDPLLYSKHRKLYRQHIGSPFPPAVALIFIVHLVFITGIAALPQHAVILLLCDIIVPVIITIRRTGFFFNAGFIQWIREYISFFVSPFVLIGALIYGSIRFRYLFLM